MSGGPAREHFFHFCEIGFAAIILADVKRQGGLRQSLAEHTLSPGDVDQGGVGRQAHHVRLKQRAIAQDEHSHDRQRNPVLSDKTIREGWGHKTQSSRLSRDAARSLPRTYTLCGVPSRGPPSLRRPKNLRVDISSGARRGRWSKI